MSLRTKFQRILDRYAVWLLAGSVLVSLLVTLYPFRFSLYGRILHFTRYFDTGVEYSGYLEPLANMLLFVPIGFLFAILWKRRVPYWGLVFALTLSLCTSLSGLIEIFQLGLPSRHPSLKDILMNSVGGIIGFVLLRMWVAYNERSRWWSSVRTWSLVYLTYIIFVLLVSGFFGRHHVMWSLTTWDTEYPLVIGNEASGDRPWSGSVSNLLIMDRALTESEVASLQSSGGLSEKLSGAALAFYPLDTQDALQTSVGRSPNLVWTPSPPPQADESDLMLGSSRWLVSSSPLRKVARRLGRRSEFTISAEIFSSTSLQGGPARIISISKDPFQRNLTLSQDGADLEIRIRSHIAGENGTRVIFEVPRFFAKPKLHHVIITYSTSSLRVFVDGELKNYVELTPELSTVLSFANIIGRIRVVLSEQGNDIFRSIFYGIVFLPLGLLLGLLAGLHIDRIPERFVMIGITVTAQSFLVQALFSAGSLSAIDVSSFATGVIVAGFGSFLGLAVVAWTNKRYASCSEELNTM